MRTLDWYFDFVSPFSYFCLHRFKELPEDISIVYRPVLFAGLLKHWGQKGPAEIPAKRRWTYRWCTWSARELDLTFRFPEQHPFNPLPHLRLALACSSHPDAVKRIFDWIWMTGENATGPDRFAKLCATLANQFDQPYGLFGALEISPGEKPRVNFIDERQGSSHHLDVHQ